MNHVAALPRDIVASGAAPLPPHDGRNRRSAETRRKIIEAAKAMISETSTAPTVVGVAKRADVSVRSVFQHFGDVESLFVTVADDIRDGIRMPELEVDGQPLVVRINAAVTMLAEIYEKIVPLRVASGQFVGHPALMQRRAAARQQLHELVRTMFAPELRHLDGEAREELVSAICSALALDDWVGLRRRDDFDFAHAIAVWRRHLTALLDYAVHAQKAA